VRILHVNKFLYRRGGAESYLEDAAELMAAAGHEVGFWGMQHPENTHLGLADTFPDQVELSPAPAGVRAKLGTAARMVWSTQARRLVGEALDRFRPDVVHLHNIYHQLSPAILGPMKQRGLPVVMTLHDYKLVCPSYHLLDHGRACDACLDGRFRHAVQRRCKDGSLALSGLLAAETAVHRRLHAYRGVDLFLCPSRFLHDKVATVELYRDRLRLLPNFVVPSGPPSMGDPDGPVVAAARLSAEKGVDTLVRAAAHLPPGRRVAIAGDGPEAAALARLAAEVAPGRVDLLGRLDRGEVGKLFAGASVVVCPSRVQENQPMTLIEAMAAGVPMVGTDLGGTGELIREGVDGALAPAEDPVALGAAISRVLKPDKWRHLGIAAHRRFEEDFAPDTHRERLTEAYTQAQTAARQGGR
jgi:glycosyltransferase involved in cell wall biosynthesis